MSNCPSCGTPVAPPGRFCIRCGAPLAPPATYYPYPPYYPPVAPPHKDNTALIVVLVVLLVVMSVGMPALLYVMVSGLIPPPIQTNPPVAIGVVVTKSADGTNWILTFTSVPTGLSQNSTTLTLFSGSGATLLPSTTMYQLEGNGLNGVRYIPAITGATFTTCAAADQILVATGSGTNQYPAGTGFQISNAGRISAAGTVQ